MTKKKACSLPGNDDQQSNLGIGFAFLLTFFIYIYFS